MTILTQYKTHFLILHIQKGDRGSYTVNSAVELWPTRQQLNCRLKKVIIDEGYTIPSETAIDEDLEQNAKRPFKHFY